MTHKRFGLIQGLSQKARRASGEYTDHKTRAHPSHHTGTRVLYGRCPTQDKTKRNEREEREREAYTRAVAWNASSSIHARAKAVDVLLRSEPQLTKRVVQTCKTTAQVLYSEYSISEFMHDLSLCMYTLRRRLQKTPSG